LASSGSTYRFKGVEEIEKSLRLSVETTFENTRELLGAAGYRSEQPPPHHARIGRHQQSFW